MAGFQSVLYINVYLSYNIINDITIDLNHLYIFNTFIIKTNKQ